MASLKAWKVTANNTFEKLYIQHQFPMMGLDYHDVRPLYLHPTTLESDELQGFENEFDPSKIQRNLMFRIELPNAGQGCK